MFAVLYQLDETAIPYRPIVPSFLSLPIHVCNLQPQQVCVPLPISYQVYSFTFPSTLQAGKGGYLPDQIQPHHEPYRFHFYKIEVQL